MYIHLYIYIYIYNIYICIYIDLIPDEIKGESLTPSNPPPTLPSLPSGFVMPAVLAAGVPDIGYWRQIAACIWRCAKPPVPPIPNIGGEIADFAGDTSLSEW